MCARWKKGYSIDELCREIKSVVKVTTNAESAFEYGDPFRFDRCEAILESAVEFQSSIPKLVQGSLVGEALREAIVSDRLNATELLNLVSALEGKYLSQSPRSYVIVTNFLSRPVPPVRSFRVDNTTLTFTDDLPPRFSKRDMNWRMQYMFPDKPWLEFPYVRVCLQAKAVEEAVEKALDALGLLTGIWTLVATRKSYVLSSSSNRSLGLVRFGPTYTVHDSKGKLLANTFWFDGNYHPEDVRNKRGVRWEALRRGEQKIRRAIRRTKNPEDIKRAFVLYSSAMAELDPNSAILKLWSTLEYLTCTDHDNLGKTASRAARLFGNKTFLEMELNHIRQYRNSFVHRDESSASKSIVAHQIKKYVEEYILFLISSRARKKTRGEIAELLDSSSNKLSARTRISVLREALAIIDGESSPRL